jgi:hypothetical protein
MLDTMLPARLIRALDRIFLMRTMYEEWKLEDWQTPISPMKYPAMQWLLDDGLTLTILIGDSNSPEDHYVRFVFEKYPAYRSINESYRTELWSMINSNRNAKVGWTFTVPNSPWIKSFSQETLLLIFPELVHYVIGTIDDVIEVLSPTPPKIEEVVADEMRN